MFLQKSLLYTQKIVDFGQFSIFEPKATCLLGVYLAILLVEIFYKCLGSVRNLSQCRIDGHGQHSSELSESCV